MLLAFVSPASSGAEGVRLSGPVVHENLAIYFVHGPSAGGPVPLTLQEDDRLYVHSEASNPSKWRYVQNTSDAGRSILATSAHATFCGHIHRPALYSMSSTAKMTSFVPTADVPVQLLGGRQWLAVLGSVGQPRDGDAAASFAMFDTGTKEIIYCRVPYDVEAAARRIRENGLPHWLADRLVAGR